MTDGRRCGQLEDAIATIAGAARPPRPWRDGARFPWHDPEFSRRTLAVHLDPNTHMASRAPEIIDRHVRWLDGLLRSRAPTRPRGPLRLLDVGCGPGLYALPLARLGHEVVGIDVSPAALDHARRLAEGQRLPCRFLQVDLARLDDAAGDIGPVEAAVLWYGEFNSFAPDEIRAFLRCVSRLLVPGGLLVVEYQPESSFPRQDFQQWEACRRSVFSDRPHLWLREYHWDETSRSEITVHWIIDAASGAVTRFAQSGRAWSEDELVALLDETGLHDVAFHPPIVGIDPAYEFPLLVATRR